MAEESNAKTDVADGTVTDADLDSAAEAAEEKAAEAKTETEEQEEVSAEEQVVEEEQQPVPSQAEKELEVLKRRFNKYESNIGTLMASVNEIKTHLSSTPKNDPEYEIPTNWDEQRNVVQKIIQEERQKEAAAAKQYESSYLQTVTELTPQDMPKDEIEGIQTELFTNFNVRHSDDGARDAATNFARASRAYYSKRTAKPLKEVPVKGGKVEEPLGGATSQKATSAKTGPEVKLDEEALEYIRSVGMDEEEAKKVLKKGMPAYLGG